MSTVTTYKKISDGVYERTDVTTNIIQVSLSSLQDKVVSMQSGADDMTRDIQTVQDLIAYLQTL